MSPQRKIVYNFVIYRGKATKFGRIGIYRLRKPCKVKFGQIFPLSGRKTEKSGPGVKTIPAERRRAFEWKPGLSNYFIAPQKHEYETSSCSTNMTYTVTSV